VIGIEHVPCSITRLPPYAGLKRGGVHKHNTTQHNTTQQELPTPVEALRHKTVGQIACGSGHTVILTDDGEVSVPSRRRPALCACWLDLSCDSTTHETKT
jgi:hypothetical protein